MATPQDRGPPSTAAIAISTALISALFGFYLGQAKSIGLFGADGANGPSARIGGVRMQHASENGDEEVTSEDDDDDDDSDDAQNLREPKSFPDNNEECKLVLVVRTDLGMGKGKIAAQCSHATLACYKALVRANQSHPILKQWERLGQAKVALKVDSEDEMLTLQAQALSLGLCARVIHDAGRTQIASGSATVLGVGPAPKSKVDEVTGHLKLL